MNSDTKEGMPNKSHMDYMSRLWRKRTNQNVNPNSNNNNKFMTNHIKEVANAKIASLSKQQSNEGQTETLCLNTNNDTHTIYYQCKKKRKLEKKSTDEDRQQQQQQHLSSILKQQQKKQKHINGYNFHISDCMHIDIPKQQISMINDSNDNDNDNYNDNYNYNYNENNEGNTSMSDVNSYSNSDYNNSNYVNLITTQTHQQQHNIATMPSNNNNRTPSSNSSSNNTLSSQQQQQQLEIKNKQILFLRNCQQKYQCVWLKLIVNELIENEWWPVFDCEMETFMNERRKRYETYYFKHSNLSDGLMLALALYTSSDIYLHLHNQKKWNILNKQQILQVYQWQQNNTNITKNIKLQQTQIGTETDDTEENEQSMVDDGFFWVNKKYKQPIKKKEIIPKTLPICKLGYIFYL